MSEMISGSCHCGAVRFRISRPEKVNLCNCSICRRLGTLWAYAPPATLELHAPEGATIAYTHGDKGLAFHSCATCGCTTHWAGIVNDRMAVNMRLVDDPADLDDLMVAFFDGADTWEEIGDKVPYHSLRL